MIVFDVGSIDNYLVVGLKLVHVSQFIVRYPQEWIEPKNACNEFAHNYIHIVVMGDVGLLMAYDEPLAASNPGDMRVGLNVALSGGVSDPRNSLVMRMFGLVNIGERAGTGMPDAISAMQNDLKANVEYSIQLEPNRTIIRISLPDCTENPGDCTENAQKNDSIIDISQEILKLIKLNKNITTTEMSKKLGVSLRNIAMRIKALQEGNIIKRQGPDKGGFWVVL